MDEAGLKVALGARIKALRKHKGMTQEDLAAATGRAVEAVSNIERGKNFPGLATLFKIADALDTTATALIAEDASPKGSARRIRLEVALLDAARALPERQLEIAVKQVQALGGFE